MLKDILDYENHRLGDFAKDHPELFSAMDRACDKLVDTGFYLNDRIISKSNFGAYGEMLLLVHQWLTSSVIRFLVKDYDQGMSLLRMCTEQARDLCVLLDEPAYFYLWKRYRTNRDSLEFEDQKKFRQLFRFSEKWKGGEKAKALYDHTSEIGIHGSGIITSIYRKSSTSDSYKLLAPLLSGLFYLPSMCRDRLQSFLVEHHALIEKEFDAPLDGFLMDLDMRYAAIDAFILVAMNEYKKLAPQLNGG